MTDIQSEGASDFDFMAAKEAPTKDEPEPKTKKKTKKDLEKELATVGAVTAEIIKEARELAGSPKGMDIDTFMQKHKLVGVDVEQLLTAPLNKDGLYA